MVLRMGLLAPTINGPELELTRTVAPVIGFTLKELTLEDAFGAVRIYLEDPVLFPSFDLNLTVIGNSPKIFVGTVPDRTAPLFLSQFGSPVNV